MPSDHDQVANLDAELDALTSPTTLEVLAHSQDYDAGIVAASGVRRAFGAGGGGSQPAGGTTGQVLEKLSNADGDVGWGDGGGYTPPTEWEQLQGSNVTIPDGNDASLTWDTKIAGSDLLDLSIPINPVIITAGIYAVTVYAGAGSAMTVGGWWNMFLELDQAGANFVAVIDQVIATAAVRAPRFTLGLTGYLPAGAQLQVNVHNGDGASDLPFAIQFAQIQRIT